MTTCPTCGEHYFDFAWEPKHVCPPAWNVTLHMRTAYNCGFGAEDRPARTIYAAKPEDAAAQYAEWFDYEHLSGDLAKEDDSLWVYVRPAGDPDAAPLLLKAHGCMEPVYGAAAPLLDSDRPRCGWYVRCKEPAAEDDYLCAKHRAEEDAACPDWQEDAATQYATA